jgi:hypothetical protein
MFNFNQLSMMKKTVILTLACVVAGLAVAQQLTANIKPISRVTPGASFEWTETIHDFGTIHLNEPVHHEFIFTNTGNEPLVITSVHASCGCTVTEYSQEAIPSGRKGFVKATFNAAKPGVFSKTITIKANTDEDDVHLTIKGKVVE